MSTTEHLLHNSKTEIRMQWLAIICMGIGLITSIYYQANELKAKHIESEINSYLHLNDRYHKLLFTLLQTDTEIFKKTDADSIHKNKYLMYELFELFATVDLLEAHFDELADEVRPCWKKRMEFMFSKPPVRLAWQYHIRYAAKIYKPEFIAHVESIIAQTPVPNSSHPDEQAQ